MKTWGESGYTRPKFRHGWQWCWEWLPLAGRVCAPSSLWARSSWLIYISCLFSSSLNSTGFASLEVEAARLSSTPGAECVWACPWDSEPRVSAVTNKWPVTTPPVCSCISVAPGSISRPQQASEEITITAILVEFWPALCIPGVSFLYLFQVPLFSGGSQGQEVHGSRCCPSELLGARERGEISLPSHLMPQFSLLGQVDHTVKSGSRLGLGKHFIHEVVTGFPLSVLSPDSPLP